MLPGQNLIGGPSVSASRGQLQLLALMVAHDLVAMLFELFLKILTDLTQFPSDQVRWDVSNPFSAALPAMDSALADTLNDEDAFRMAAAVVKGANWNGFGPMEIANCKFASVPMGGSLELVASFPKRGAVVIRCIDASKTCRPLLKRPPSARGRSWSTPRNEQMKNLPKAPY